MSKKCISSLQSNMAISQGMILEIVSIDRTQKVLFTKKYIIKGQYILKLS